MVNKPTNELQLLIKALGYLKTHWWMIAIEIVSIFLGGVYIFHHTPQYLNHTRHSSSTAPDGRSTSKSFRRAIRITLSLVDKTWPTFSRVMMLWKEPRHS